LHKILVFYTEADPEILKKGERALAAEKVSPLKNSKILRYFGSEIESFTNIGW
jgi:hypothetical protein